MVEATDPVMARVGEAVELFGSGDVERARAVFARLWSELSAAGDPFHRCVLAHHAADTAPDVEQELWWDLRALEAAHEVSDERAEQFDGSLGIAGFYPSLHLNLAEDYRKLGDAERARRHITVAEQGLGTLGDDEYGRMIRGAVERSASAIGRLPPPDP